MVDIRSLSPRAGDVVLLVGTTKGAFLFRSGPTRGRWERGGPHFPGHAVYAMAYDGRAGRRRLWAAPESMHWGSVMRSSDDFGRTWTQDDEGNVRFPGDTGKSLQRIWQIAGRDDDPQTMYCGVEPAALFESRDAGASWSLVKGLWDHPHRKQWQPGGGGLLQAAGDQVGHRPLHGPSLLTWGHQVGGHEDAELVQLPNRLQQRA